jgi:hypothetical protein
MEDVSLLVLLHLMLRHAEASGKHEHSELVESWRNTLTTYGPGVIDLQLDAIVSDPSRRSYFLGLLDEVEAELDQVGDVYPGALIKKGWLTRGVIMADYKTAGVHSAVTTLRDLLR